MPSQINSPAGVFVTPNGEVFFCDRGNQRVRKILRTGETVTIAGTGKRGYNGDDQPATQAQLYEPSSVFVSSRNEVYISEAIGQRIRKIQSNGNIVTVVGTGIGGYNGDGIPATEAMIQYPYGIFVTEQDELYFADYCNSRIRKVFNGIITTVAGTGIDGYNGDGLLAKNTDLQCPICVSISETNEMYIVEHNRVRKVNSNGIVSTIAGTGVNGCNTSGVLATNARLNDPWFVTVVNGEVYIAEYVNNRIRKILRNGIIVTIAGTDDGYNVDGILATSVQLSSPNCVFVTNNGEIYISEYKGCRIRKINSHGIISTIAGYSGVGIPGYSGDVPFDFRKYPHIGARTKPIKPFPKSYLDVSIQCQME